MAWLTEEQLEALGLKHLGQDVKISDKASLLNPDQLSIGDRSRIDDFCVLSGNVTIEHNVHVTVFCNLAGGEPGITIGAFCGIAYGSHIFAQSDDYSGQELVGPTVPEKYRTSTVKEPVILEKFCNLGAHALVTPGVTLAEGTVVGMKSLITRSTKPWTIYFGIPAKPLKPRHQDMVALAEQYMRELDES